MSVINPATNTVTATIAVGDFPLGGAVNPVTGALYVTMCGAGRTSVISGGWTGHRSIPFRTWSGHALTARTYQAIGMAKR